LMVTPVATDVNAAVHAAWALACALEPPAVIVPVSVDRSTVGAADLVAVGVEVAVLEEHDESAIAVTRAIAPTAATFLSFTVCLSGFGLCSWRPSALVARKHQSGVRSVPTQ
jgi:hypothetical protein